MKNRIKIIYVLTAVALALLFMVQCGWLYSQYIQSTEQRGSEVATIAQRIVDEDRKRRSEIKSDKEESIPIVISHSSNIDYIKDTLSQVNVINITIEDSTFVFKVENNISREKVFDAPMRFILEERIPLQINTIDSLLRARGVSAHIATIQHDTMAW